MSLDYEDRGPLSAIKDYAEFNVAYDGWGTQFEDEEQYSSVCLVIELKADTCMYQLYLSVNHGARMCGLFQVFFQYPFCLRRSKNFQNH